MGLHGAVRGRAFKITTGLDTAAPRPVDLVIGLFKIEVIRRRGPWRNIDDVEYAVLEWVDWFNHHRLLEPIGMIPPTEKDIYGNNRQNLTGWGGHLSAPMQTRVRAGNGRT